MSSLLWKNNGRNGVTDGRALCGVLLVFSVGSLQNSSCRTIQKSSWGGPKTPSPSVPSPSRWHCRHNVRTRRVANNFLGSGDLGDGEGWKKRRRRGFDQFRRRGEKRPPPPHRRWQSLTAVVCAHCSSTPPKYEWGKVVT